MGPRSHTLLGSALLPQLVSGGFQRDCPYIYFRVSSVFCALRWATVGPSRQEQELLRGLRASGTILKRKAVSWLCHGVPHDTSLSLLIFCKSQISLSQRLQRHTRSAPSKPAPSSPSHTLLLCEHQRCPWKPILGNDQGDCERDSHKNMRM